MKILQKENRPENMDCSTEGSGEEQRDVADLNVADKLCTKPKEKYAEAKQELTEAEALRKFKTNNSKMDKAGKMFADVFKSSIKGAKGGKAIELGYEISKLINELHARTFPKVVRSKLHNLRENAKMCKGIYEGEISCIEFVKMSANEMKSEELKSKDDVLLKDSLLAAQVAVAAAETEMFTCSRCKQNKCTYSQMQTRSCDEPMTTFVHCTVCGHRWRF